MLHIKVSGVAVKTFSYDAAGRTTQIATSSYTRNFSYDYEGRISQITGLPTTNTFTYNGFDTRTKKVDSAGTANFKRLGAGVTAPVVDDGAATYTPGISERRSGTTTYLHAGLKTLDQRTNSSQANTGTKRYDAFGNVVSSTGSWASPWGYAGKFGYQSGDDAEIMLLGHRYYDASTGRFLTRDPARDGRNWYAYCAGTPARNADPAGHSVISVGASAQFILPGASGMLGLGIVVDLERFSLGVSVEHGGGHGWGDLMDIGPSVSLTDTAPVEGWSTSLVSGAAFEAGLQVEPTVSWPITPIGLGEPSYGIELSGVGGGAGAYSEIHVQGYHKLFDIEDIVAPIREEVAPVFPTPMEWYNLLIPR